MRQCASTTSALKSGSPWSAANPWSAASDPWAWTEPEHGEQLMVETPTVAYSRVHPADRWLESIGVPVFHGYYIEDLRTMGLGYWDRRGCEVAFLELAGQEGVSGASLIEIPPGKTL